MRLSRNNRYLKGSCSYIMEDNMVAGARQTMRMLEKGRIGEIYLAKDADLFITMPLLKMAEDMGIRVVNEYSRAELGRKCGIDKGAAAAGRFL